MTVTGQIIEDIIKTGTRKELIDCIHEFAGEEYDMNKLWALAKKDMSELRTVCRNILKNYT